MSIQPKRSTKVQKLIIPSYFPDDQYQDYYRVKYHNLMENIGCRETNIDLYHRVLVSSQRKCKCLLQVPDPGSQTSDPLNMVYSRQDHTMCLILVQKREFILSGQSPSPITQ